MLEQRGSNITSERLRFDFSFDRKIEKEELEEIENEVNEIINKDLKGRNEEMTYEKSLRKKTPLVYSKINMICLK